MAGITLQPRDFSWSLRGCAGFVRVLRPKGKGRRSVEAPRRFCRGRLCELAPDGRGTIGTRRKPKDAVSALGVHETSKAAPSIEKSCRQCSDKPAFGVAAKSERPASICRRSLTPFQCLCLNQ